MKSKKHRIIILSGGSSEERKISLVSGDKIKNAFSEMNYSAVKVDPTNYANLSNLLTDLRKQNPYIIFNALHGGEGENGLIQAVFEKEGLPFTGCDYKSSAICMDKHLSTSLAEMLNIPVPKSIIIKEKKSINSINTKLIISKLKLPLIVKPNNSGSSVGISIVREEQNITRAISDCRKISSEILFQQFIEGRELTVTILGNKCLPVVEIIPQEGFYDYKNKYTKGNTTYQTPAKLNENEKKEIQKFAELIFSYIGCSVYGRVDFRYDGKKFYFLEVNTLPGMTPLSLTPMAAKQAGISFNELLEIIVELSLKKTNL